MWIPFSGKDDRADWVKVLETIYDEQLISHSPLVTPKKHGRDRQYAILHLSKILEINPDNLEEILNQLEEMGYIDRIENPQYPSQNNQRITKDGLELAHQIKTERQRRYTNIILLVLTAILTLLTVILVGAELGHI